VIQEAEKALNEMDAELYPKATKRKNKRNGGVR
jgi:hypothetical protein